MPCYHRTTTWSCYCGNVTRLTQKVPKIPAHHRNVSTVFAQARYLVIFLMVHSNTPSTHKPHKNVTNKGYKSTYKSNILRWEGFFRCFGFPHNKQKQDEQPSPYPQHLCHILPWQHPPWPQITVPRLPMSLLKAPIGGFAIDAAGSFAWGGAVT